MNNGTNIGGLPTTPLRGQCDKQDFATTLQATIHVNKERTVTAQITKSRDEVGAPRAQVSMTFCHKVIKALAELKAEVAKVKRDVRTLKEMGLMTQKHLQFCSRVGDDLSRLPNGGTPMKDTFPPKASGVRKGTCNEKELEERIWRGTPSRSDRQEDYEDARTHFQSPFRRSLSTQGQAIPTMVRPRSPSPTISDITSPERNYSSLDVLRILPKVEDGNMSMAWRETNETETPCDELISNLMNGPMVRANDMYALQAFVDEIWACVRRLEATGMLEAVETKCFLLKVTKRFCGGLQQEYDDRANKLEKSNGSYPGMKWLKDFVLEVLGRVSTPLSREKPEVSVPEQSKSQMSPQRSELKSPSQEMCPICPGDHTLNGCAKFRMMCIQDRIEMVKTLSYCFLCLGGKHIASSCGMRIKCGVNQCFGRHSHLLHLPRDTRGTSGANIEDQRRPYRSTQSEARNCDGDKNTLRVKREPSPEIRGEPEESYRDSKRARSWEFQEEKRHAGFSRPREPMKETDTHDSSRWARTHLSRQT